MPVDIACGGIVKVLRLADDGIAGVGFAVGDRFIFLSCAHVVNAAMGREPTSVDRPADRDRLLVEFPLNGGPAGRADPPGSRHCLATSSACRWR